jgi:glycosyltransferase involved in cell wall biosynthesis
VTLSIVYAGTLPPHHGGSAISAALILQGLAARGHRVRCVAPMIPGEDDRFAADNPRLDVTRFAVPWFETNPGLPPGGTYREDQQAVVCRLLSRILDEARPDLCFVGRESFAPGVPDLAHRRGVPVVQRLAGGLTMGLAAGGYPEAVAASLIAELGKADLRVAPGRHVAEVARRLGFGEVTVILTAANYLRFRDAERDPRLAAEVGIPAGAVVVGHVANLKPAKRSLDVVRSAVAACARDRRLLYLIVGDGQLRGDMEAEVGAAGLGERVRFVGWRDYAEVPAYLALTDIVVMPSEAEGLARAYVEAQASGRVLLASDIPQACEVVTHGVTGWLFPSGDVAALAEATVRLARDPDLRETIGGHARESARAHDLEPAITAYERLLTDLGASRLVQ